MTNAKTEIAGIAQVNPPEAYALLEAGDCVLVDVRTRAEWTFVGTPDLSNLATQTLLVEWRSFPDMAPKDGFGAELLSALGGQVPARLLFLCRSGVRSQQAALAVQSALDAEGRSAQCFNVAEGFEGDPDAGGHRGVVNGWKSHGLPWRQS